MLPSLRRWAESMTQLCTVKVKLILTGNGIYPSILCPLHIFRTLRTIFVKLHSTVPPSETMCRTMLINIEVSKLSIYRDEDLKYITPKILFSVLLFLLLNICFSERRFFEASKHIPNKKRNAPSLRKITSDRPI